ncbi:MAG: transcription termination factor Rho [Acidimicrobiia bacterium]
MDSTNLERSALEKKDRDELTTIAVALGGKPGSRAKKAAIVDLILELTGVAAPPLPLAEPEPPADPAPADEPTAEPEAEGPADEPAAQDAPAEEPPAAEPPAGPDEATDPPSPRAEPAARTRPARSGSGRRGTGGAPVEEPPAEWEIENGAEPAGGGPAGGQGQPGDDGENGNRRRRRRGRNRERGAEPTTEEIATEPVEVAGLLDLRDEGYGFLRLHGYLPSKDDVYVSVKQVRQFGLRRGDHISGASRAALRNEKNPALLRIDAVNGADPDQARSRRRFEDLTPLFPDERLRLELPNEPSNTTARIIDLISPIGKGQRGLVVSPPKAGKTTVVKQIVRSIEVNNPEVHLFVLLVDERPEEVTDMRRWLRNETSTVVASTFDRPSDEHIQVAELAIERAKRLVEAGHDVAVVLDGITRLSRAYNLAAPTTGRVMTGGIDSGALYPPKKFFGAGRNVEEGGSLTILATALVETGSRMDEIIFEEFKGTGNWELRLDRRLAERRVYPAIDVEASSTRHEELLFPRVQLQSVWKLRRVLSNMTTGGEGERSYATGLELLLDRMATFRSNEEFLAEIAKAPLGG